MSRKVMTILSKPDGIRWWAASVAVVAAAFAVSFLSGKEAVKSCLAAVTVSGIAGGIAMLPIIYAVAYKPALLTVLGLATGTLRLLLMLAGSIIIILFVKVSVLWFVVWIGVFYSAMLILEVGSVIRTANRRKITGVGKL